MLNICAAAIPLLVQLVDFFFAIEVEPNHDWRLIMKILTKLPVREKYSAATL